MTTTEALKLLELTRPFTQEQLQSAWRSAARDAHPDAGGSDEEMAQLNAARDLLEPMATAKKVGRAKTLKLVISADGSVVGPDGVRHGSCGSVAAATSFCERAGWDFELSRELQAA